VIGVGIGSSVGIMGGEEEDGAGRRRSKHVNRTPHLDTDANSNDFQKTLPAIDSYFDL